MTTIKIGAMVFTVCEVDNLCDVNGSKIDGTIWHNDCEIVIDNSLSSQTKRQVIWHEILHSIMLQTGLVEHDEKLIEALSFGIFGVLQNNEYLRKKVRVTS